MFEADIAHAREMIERLEKNKSAGLDASGKQRVSLDEFRIWQSGAETHVHDAFGRRSDELKQWRATAATRDNYVSDAIAHYGPAHAFDGYIDFLNTAIGQLNSLEAALASRGGSAPSPREAAYRAIQRLPKAARVGILATILVAAGAMGIWSTLPESTQERVIGAITQTGETVVAIRGIVPERIEDITVDYQIDETNNSHEPFGTNTRAYAKSFNASPEYRIVSYEWKETGSTRMSDRVVNVDAGGKLIVMSFKLKAGPVTDRYRGWVHGTLRTVQRRVHPARTEMIIPSVSIRPGDNLSFPGSSLSGFARIEILDANNVVVATGPASAPLQAKPLGLTFQIAETSAGLSVAVKRSKT